MSDGAEYVHHIVELPADLRGFRYDVERAVGFSRNPLYAIIHEASYADGGTTRWAADRLLPPDFDAQAAVIAVAGVLPGSTRVMPLEARSAELCRVGLRDV